MNKIKRIMALCLSFMLCLSLSIPVYAQYDGNRYEHVDDTWYVTDYHGSPCNVILYTLIQDRYAFPGTGHGFSFSCNEAEFSTGVTMATMEYFYYSDKPVEEINVGKIFHGDFGLEPGQYSFIGGGDNVVLCFDNSISAIDLPTPDAYSAYEAANTVTMKEGDTLYIFALKGDYDWVKESYNEFYDWSIQKRNQHENYFSSSVLAEKEPEKEEVLEPYYECQEDGTHFYCTYNEKEEIVKLKEDCTYNASVCIYCDGLRPIEEVEVDESVVTIEPEKPELQNYITLILGILVLVAIFVIAKIRKR